MLILILLYGGVGANSLDSIFLSYRKILTRLKLLNLKTKNRADKFKNIRYTMIIVINY